MIQRRCVSPRYSAIPICLNNPSELELPQLCEIRAGVWDSLRGTLAKNQSRIVASAVLCSDRSCSEFLRCTGANGAGLLFSSRTLFCLPLGRRHATLTVFASVVLVVLLLYTNPSMFSRKGELPLMRVGSPFGAAFRWSPGYTDEVICKAAQITQEELRQKRPGQTISKSKAAAIGGSLRRAIPIFLAQKQLEQDREASRSELSLRSPGSVARRRV